MGIVRSFRNRFFSGATGALMLVWGCGATISGSQAPAPNAVPMAEQVFKNVQILRGIPVDQFMGTMGFLSASLGLNCTDCHVDESGSNWDRYADDNDLKRTSRRMMAMVQMINKASFGGQPVVTCNTCHRGFRKPNVMPSLNQLYGSPGPDEPGDPFVAAAVGPVKDSPEALLDRHVAAVGGTQRLAALTGISAKGTYIAFDDAERSPVELWTTANGRRTVLAHVPAGDSYWTYDGTDGWIAGPPTDRPMPIIAVTGQELEGLATEIDVFFPTRLKQRLRNLRVGIPAVLEDDTEVNLVQGQTAGGTVVTLCFDAETGLLRRLVRYAQSPVGRLVTRVDYTEYKEVAGGVRVPSKWTTAWLSGRTHYELTEIVANAPIDGARFTKPTLK